MIIELAQISVRPGSEQKFLDAYTEAQKFLASSPGYMSHSLRRSIESPNRFLLTVEWQRLEDHTEGFRGSPAFASWRSLIGPFFESAPVVEHFQ